VTEIGSLGAGVLRSLVVSSPGFPTTTAVISQMNRRLGAVKGLYELCADDLWTACRSTLSEANCRCELSYLALFSGLQSNACVVCLSRLETRTKESNMYASHWECKPKGIMKVKNSIANLRRDHGFTWYSVRFTE
jgi:hypothetical protein